MKSFLSLILMLFGLAQAQQPAAPPATVATADPVVQAAQDFIGRTLILRGLNGGTNLAFDAHGHLVSGESKPVDWTLAGMNVEKVSRSTPGDLLLEGPRVAIRYNPAQRQFERHMLKDEPLRITFPAPDAAGVVRSMEAIFSVGIDPALQRSMPPFWKHYFLPATVWTVEDAVGTVLSINGATTLPPGTVMPVVLSKGDLPELTGEAQKDKVHGEVRVRIAVGLDGIPRQITVRQPLGYGLDAKAAEAVARYKFQPGSKDGTPVVIEMIVSQTF